MMKYVKTSSQAQFVFGINRPPLIEFDARFVFNVCICIANSVPDLQNVLDQGLKALYVAAAFFPQIWHIKTAHTLFPSIQNLAIIFRAFERFHARDVLDKQAGRECDT